MKKPSTKNAVVTGAGRRLGRRIALALAEAGFNVVVHYNGSASGARETAARIRALGRAAIPVRADLSKPEHVRRMSDRVGEEFGRVDLLVNNAGLFGNGTLLKTSDREWDRLMNVNARGMFLVSRGIVPLMKNRGSQIVNIVSLGGIHAWSKHLAYSVSKAAAIMLTRCMAKDLAPRIRVNGIAPGTVIIDGEEDPMLAHVSLKTIPLKSYGTPDDIIQAVLFLATRAPYMTGQILSIDGGRSI